MKDLLEKIYDYSLEEIIGERFGRYSKYIIQDRAIPDVRDGLKPVQRRILYSMYKEKNTYDRPYLKSARAIGDVMGKYHPHGDTSIYEAMVRMSQWWKTKNLLIDMHGNNGSIDGDSPAAIRYTEARLSKISNELLRDIEKDTVIFTPNYDDKLLEPTVLPARFPNLLVNGSSGISAGYATNIPPHNLGEVIDATIKRIDSPNCHFYSILEIIKGPDFPTGGIICGKEGIIEAYKTGKGKIYLKAKTRIEKSKGKNQIIIDEIPYEVNKTYLVKKIDEIRIDKKINGIIDVRDESDRQGLRIVIELKKDANSEFILNYLLKNTDLLITYNFNMVAIVNRRPKLLGILDILDAYIEHQKEVVTKRTKFDLDTALHQLHIVEGLIKALSILDDIIKTIRASKDKEDAEHNLIEKYQFTDAQAKAIVTLQLYKLTNTDVTLLEKKAKDLNIIIKKLNAILSDEKLLKKIIKDELRKIKEEYNKERLTLVEEEVVEIKVDNNLMIPKEEVIVIVTNDGYIKRVSNRSYAASCHEPTLLKELDYIIGMYEMNTLDTLLLFTNLGNYLYIPVHEIPDTKWKELGKHISNIIPIKAEEKIIGCIPVYNFNDNIYITTFTKLGMIKRTILSEYKATRYSKPLTAIKLKPKDEVVSISYSSATDVFIATYNGYGLWYDLKEVPITGLRTSGVKAMSLKNDYVINGLIFDPNEEFITVITNRGTGKRLRLASLEKKTRNRKGLLLIREVKNKPYQLIKIFITDVKKIIGIKTVNDLVYLKINDLTIMDRYSTGNNIVKTNIIDAFEVIELIKNNKVDKNDINDKPEILLEEIDERISKVDLSLNNVDF